ncbi:restriction endonuclease [Helicobacter sp. 23-1045]
MESLPHLLNEMVDFLRAQNLHLSKSSRDGRINSAFNEDEIFKLLEANFDINRPNMRDWVDFSFEENGQFYPVNIKVSTTHTTDNLNCKLGIYYALTGQIPPFSNGVDWESYFRTLRENLTPNPKDYYFLIVNKEDCNDIFAASLKSLKHIIPNGNNLPFQAKWDANREIITRDFDSAKDFLLGTFEKSLKLRADAYISYKRYFCES